VVARIAAVILGSVLGSNLGSIFGSPAKRESPARPLFNLSATLVDAKGTTQDYLAHFDAIPVQIMALEPVFPGVVKA
jgi:hypothetical protein